MSDICICSRLVIIQSVPTTRIKTTTTANTSAVKFHRGLRSCPICKKKISCTHSCARARITNPNLSSWCVGNECEVAPCNHKSPSGTNVRSIESIKPVM